MEDFGFVVVTAPSDWLFGKGCLASLRYFMPKVPITVLVDGEVDTAAAERHFDVRSMRRADVSDSWLKRNSFGWGITKMVAHWEAPYQHFVSMDSDMIAWGGLEKVLFRADVDFLWSVPHALPIGPVEDYVDRWFFKPSLLEQIAPEFNWRSYVSNYSCSGIFKARRGCLSTGRYSELMGLQAAQPSLFKFGEMGMLNFMVFEMVSRGEASIAYHDFQVIFPDHTRSSLEKRFRLADGGPIVASEDPQVLHMTDAKPLIDSTTCYSEPMTFFRQEYLAATEGVRGEKALAILRVEDALYHAARQARLRKAWLRKVAGLFYGEVGAWRRLGSKLGLGT